MADILGPIMEFIHGTKVLEQIQEVQVKALFTNVYFLTPFLILMIWWIYRLALRNLVFTGLIIGLWLFSGSRFAHNFIVDGELQVEKVLPVAGVGIAAVAITIYMLFIRSD